jgi:regulatory protein
MEIIKIKKIQLKKNIVEIFFKNNKNLELLVDTIVKFNLKLGLNISKSMYKEIVSYDILKRITCDTLKLISKRSYSIKNLQRKLFQKWRDNYQNVVETIERFKKLNYINDEKFASDYAFFLAEKGKGEFVIKTELEKQGIEACLIKDVLSKIKINIDPYIQIIEILKIKFKNFNGKDYNELRRAFLFFLRRGFSYDNISGAFEDYIKKIDNSSKT